MSKKLIGILLALVVVIGGGIFFFTDGDDKDNKKETSEKVTRDYEEIKDHNDYEDNEYNEVRSTPLHIKVKAEVKDDKEVQEVLNKVAKDFGKDNRDSLEVTVLNSVEEKQGTFKIAFNKKGKGKARVDKVGKWVQTS